MEINLYSILTNKFQEYKIVAENVEQALQQAKKIDKNMEIKVIKLETKVFINK